MASSVAVPAVSSAGFSVLFIIDQLPNDQDDYSKEYSSY